MSRDLDATFEAEILKDALQPVFLAEFLFDGGDVRFFSGTGEITWDSKTFYGAGNLLSVSEIEETQQTEASGVAFNLNGINSSIISIALQEEYQGREANLWLACVDDTRALVGEPVLIFSGFMDIMEIIESGENCSITLTVENKLAILKTKKTGRYTPEDQKRRYPGDLGLDYQPVIQDKEIIWGRKTST